MSRARQISWLLAALAMVGLGAGVASGQAKPSKRATSRATATAVATAAQAQASPAARSPRTANPRIGSVKWRTWIWPTPYRSRNHIALGAVRLGTTVALKSDQPVSGNKWFAVEPYGYVFADDTTTRDFDSPYWQALRSVAPKPGPWPYPYAFSTGAPMYSRIPTPKEQGSCENGLGPKRTFKPLGKWSESHEVLVLRDPKDGIQPTGPVPDFIRGHEPITGSPWNPANPKVKIVPAGSGVAWAKAFRAAGRVWLLTPDLLLVPADRVFPYARSSFRGIELKGDHKLPLAWVRGKQAKQLQRDAGGGFRDTGKEWRNKTYVLLTGERRELSGATYLRTREQGSSLWVKDDQALSVVEAVTKLQFGLKPDERWVQASITDGTMVAYVGLTPVWTTLWSGGKGGIPVPGNDPKKFATTELGIFPLQWKDQVATMSPDKGSPTVFWFPAVPHIQYVHAPLAIHVAFWHDNFGNLMSAECINLSGADGKWLFDFTLPKLPPGWNSIRPHKLSGPSTKIHIIP
ncbi:MAG: L,D-transpeptidase [Deltaproteobacteria bacterium]|nr:L,D-transpeptidase [Deltaproteobacteria bacterium]